jgi:hypothetical protein
MTILATTAPGLEKMSPSNLKVVVASDPPSAPTAPVASGTGASSPTASQPSPHLLLDLALIAMYLDSQGIPVQPMEALLALGVLQDAGPPLV